MNASQANESVSPSPSHTNMMIGHVIASAGGVRTNKTIVAQQPI